MIIKPDLGGRIFWGTAGATLVITACAGLSVLPFGLILTCPGLILAVFSFGYAFGATQTRVDDEGIFQRNYFLMTKKFSWNEIEKGRAVSESYNYKDSSGWTSRRTRTYFAFSSNGKNIYINQKSSGPENWWADVLNLAKTKLGDKFGN